MYLRDAKQKMVDFETKLEDYKSKLLMSDEKMVWIKQEKMGI